MNTDAGCSICGSATCVGADCVDAQVAAETGRPESGDHWQDHHRYFGAICNEDCDCECHDLGTPCAQCCVTAEEESTK